MKQIVPNVHAYLCIHWYDDNRCFGYCPISNNVTIEVNFIISPTIDI